MLAAVQPSVPEGGGWSYEPKWDGFRTLVFRDGDKVDLVSRGARPMTRYFPELVPGILALPAERVVLDGEIIIVGDDGLDFDSLQLRLQRATRGGSCRWQRTGRGLRASNRDDQWLSATGRVQPGPRMEPGGPDRPRHRARDLDSVYGRAVLYWTVRVMVRRGRLRLFHRLSCRRRGLPGPQSA